MARPRKGRKVCCLPNYKKFGPLDKHVCGREAITMTVDEYEVIRLIDLEGLNQEECSTQMGVARTTVQGIYVEARKKLASSLVNGKPLFIEGGEYELCGDRDCCKKDCHKKMDGHKKGGHKRGGHKHGGHKKFKEVELEYKIDKDEESNI